MNIPQLHTLIDTNETRQNVNDKIRGAEIREVDHAITNEVAVRGMINGVNTANLPSIIKSESGNILIPDSGIFIPFQSAGPPDNVTTFASGEVGWLWKKVIPGNPAFLSITPIIRQPVTIGTGCENIIIGSNIKTPGTIGNNCKNITIEAMEGVWSIGNDCQDIHIKHGNNLVIGDACTDIHIQHLENCSMEGGLKNTSFLGKMSDMHLTQAIHTYVYMEPGPGHRFVMSSYLSQNYGVRIGVTYDAQGLITYDIDED